MEPKSPPISPNQTGGNNNTPSTASDSTSAPTPISASNVMPASIAVPTGNLDTKTQTPAPETASVGASAPNTNTSAAPASSASQTPLENTASMASSQGSPESLTPAATSQDSAKNTSTTKPFHQQWQFYVILVLAVTALIGCAVGIVGFLESSSALERVAGLEGEIEAKNQLLVKYGTELGYKVDQYGNPIFEEKPTTPVEDPNDYIYIAEWGLKFKLPTGIKNLSYVYGDLEYGTDTIKRAARVCVTGMPNAATGQPRFADFQYIGWTGLGCLIQFPVENEDDISDEEWYQSQRAAAVYEDKDYYYVFSAPQAAYSTDMTELQWEVEAMQLVRELLTKNISTFKIEQK